mmetsp:Transcript_1252/g.3363  ORF Transcript_1252/g.3363 Transcript_1252/m.3363 type:complete len:177 (-) Transcript_1252:376-906(-)
MVVKKKKKASSKVACTMAPFQFDPPTVVDLGHKPTEYVCCRIASATLASPLDFEWPAVPTDVTIAMIKDAIVQRHGGAVADIKLYHDQVKPECLLEGRGNDNDACAIKDLGIKGLASGLPSDLPVLKILYDYTPTAREDPIVSLGPTVIGSKHGINMKVFRAMEKAEEDARWKRVR